MVSTAPGQFELILNNRYNDLRNVTCQVQVNIEDE